MCHRGRHLPHMLLWPPPHCVTVVAVRPTCCCGLPPQDNDDEVDDVRLEIGLDWVSKADIELTVKPLKVAAPGFLKSIVAGLTNIHAGAPRSPWPGAAGASHSL
jgi:hypothetical protein